MRVLQRIRVIDVMQCAPLPQAGVAALVCVLEGSLCEREQRYGADSILYRPRGDASSWTAATGGARCLVIEDLPPSLPPEPWTARVPRERSCDAQWKIATELERDDASAPLLLRALVLQLVGAALAARGGSFCDDRIRAAARALRDTDLTVAAIAKDAGFFDQAHLARRFREAFGMTPTQYRRTARARTAPRSRHPERSEESQNP